MFLTVIVPGPSNLKHKIDLYLQPLIHELSLLWEDGIQTFGLTKRDNFQLRAALMWTINNFSSYSMMSGWITAGVHDCPYYMDDSKVIYLRHSRKVNCFDSHRCLLERRHPYRKNQTNYCHGAIEKDNRPDIRMGDELLEDLDCFWVFMGI